MTFHFALDKRLSHHHYSVSLIADCAHHKRVIQFAPHYRLDEIADPFAPTRFDRIKPVVEKKSRRLNRRH